MADLQFSLNKTLPEMAAIAGLYLHDDPYSKEELSKLLDLTQAELETKILSENTRHVDSFKLRQRAFHVYQGLLLLYVFSSLKINQRFKF